MMKSATMDAFTLYSTLDGPGRIDNDEARTVHLPKIGILNGTSAMNAAV